MTRGESPNTFDYWLNQEAAGQPRGGCAWWLTIQDGSWLNLEEMRGNASFLLGGFGERLSESVRTDGLW